MQVQLPDFLSSLERNSRELHILCLFPNPSNSQSSCNQRMSRLRDVSIPLSRRLTENWTLVSVRRSRTHTIKDMLCCLLCPKVSTGNSVSPANQSKSHRQGGGQRQKPSCQEWEVAMETPSSQDQAQPCQRNAYLFPSSWGKQFLTHQICSMWLSMYLERFLWWLKQ